MKDYGCSIDFLIEQTDYANCEVNVNIQKRQTFLIRLQKQFDEKVENKTCIYMFIKFIVKFNITFRNISAI